MSAPRRAAGSARIVGVLLVLASAAACGPAPTEIDAAGLPDATFDAPPSCREDADCEDGLACNGDARCEGGRCVAGEPIRCDDSIACTTDFCSEELRRCVNRPVDGDGDGVPAASCLDGRGMPFGDDCDDASAIIFPGAMELCDAMGVDEDCDPETLGGRDGDGDGFVDVACCNGSTCGDDCNDAVRGASPAGTEVCNGIDDDCDGSIDERVQVVVYRDADGDGHGDPMMTMLACASSPGFAVLGDDCDDTSALRSPELFEACDGIDNDCDGTPDPADAPVIVTWYEDGDGDGFGDPRVRVESCGRPTGMYSLLATDCDDATAARSPAQPERCNGLDDDCNGAADFEIAPGDLEDDDLDGRADARCVPRPVDADCDDRDATSGVGGTEICDGRDNDCDSSVDEGVAASAFYRDADGDGHGSEVSGVTFGCGAVAGYVTTSDDCDDASDTRHPGADEGCNGRDDDCDARVDEDPSMSMCPLVGGLPRTCVAGRCRGGAPECPSGRADCDGLPSNGCEATLDSDPANCGGCGRRCAVDTGAFAACTGSRCTSLACAGELLDCNGDLGRGGDGCETNGATDPRSCGACGRTCGALPHVTRTRCVASACGFDPALDCDAGWSDCNGNVADGCEAQLGTDAHCASCASACAVTEECNAARMCRPRVCTAPTADCDGNGSCESNTSSDVSHCGACGSACSGRSAVWACTSGACTVSSCMGTTADCDGLDATGCEVETQTDVAHCGGCGRACTGGSASWACTAGACRIATCLGSSLDCDGSATNGCEIDGDTSVANCGGCGSACPTEPGTVAPSCAMGACAALACLAGRNDCNADLGRAGDGCETSGPCPNLTMTPTGATFGIVAAGTMGAPTTFTVFNTGSPSGSTAPIVVEAFGDHPAEFPIVADTCSGLRLFGGATCTFGVRFAPTSTGPRQAIVRVRASPGGSALATVSGTGVISFAPTSHAFGSVTVAGTSATQSFVIQNPGVVPAGLLSVSMLGPHAGDFPILMDPCSGTMLAAGATCTVTVRFAPTVAGARSATLQAVAAAGGTATSALGGTGSLPITIGPTTHGFGAVTLGGSSGTQTFTLSNPGVIPTAALTVSRIGADPTDFVVVTDLCSGVAVPAAGSCTVTLRFTPGAVGARSATLRIAGTASAGGTVDATLGGTGSSAITVAPTSHGFGAVTLGASSGTQTFTLSNPGVIATSPLTVSRIGADPADFVVVTDLCSGVAVPATGSCDVTLRFTPGAVGARSATLRIAGTAAAGGTVDATLGGTGSLPITVSPASHGFGTVTVGASSGTQTFTISNPGVLVTGALTVVRTGGNPADFVVVSDTCTGATLAATTGSCTVTLQFAPTAAGARSTTLRVSGSPGGTADASVSGSGSASITISPTSFTFPITGVGSTSAVQNFTISNPGTVATGALGFAVTGPNASEFSYATTTCTPIPAGGSCTLMVQITPTGSGSRTATLTVSATPGGSAVAALGGSGLTYALGATQMGTIFGTGAANVVDCPAGHAIVGVSGRSGTVTDRLDLLCAPLSVLTSGGTHVLATGAASVTTGAGGGGGGPYTESCGANRVATGISGANGDSLDRFGVSCGQVSFVPAWSVSIAGTGSTAQYGGGGGAPFTEACPAGTVLTGLWIGTGTYVDGVGARCRPVTAVP